MTPNARLPITPQAAAPAAYACLDYGASPGSKRCRHYLGGGECARDDHLVCEEWAKVNGHAAIARARERPRCGRDLFGHPLRKEPEANGHAAIARARERPRCERDLFGHPLRKEPEASRLEVAPAAAARPPADDDAPLVRHLADEDVASFKALGVEVCLAFGAVGEMWLVPAYTEQSRRELRIDHAATLTAICAAFPGAKVTGFRET